MLSCEDPVSVNLKDAPPVLVVDAWINDKAEVQKVFLSQTQPFFEAEIPPAITGATVTLSSSRGEVFSFVEEEVPGEYRWNPNANGNPINEIGVDYQLTINVNDETYQAVSSINRVPEIDSIKFTFEEERSPFQPEGFYGEFVSTDPVGVGDSYWIRTYKNGVYQNSPFDLTIAFDAGFSQGGAVDGVVFIQPLQDSVNPLNEDRDEIVPYAPGDSLFVEILSITNDAFFFLQEVQIQTQRDGGFDEIFAEPLENVPSNILNLDENSTNRAIGYFCMSAVSGRGRRLVE